MSPSYVIGAILPFPPLMSHRVCDSMRDVDTTLNWKEGLIGGIRELRQACMANISLVRLLGTSVFS